MSDVTQILNAIEDGDPSAADELLPLIYDELRKLAAARMAQESPDHTLQATALVHEAYVRLVDVEKAQHWDSRGHFYSAAAEAMRRILVENARRKTTKKHGAQLQRVPIDGIDVAIPVSAERLLSLDDAISRLATHEPDRAELVKLRYFGGLTIDETAEVLGISTATANRYWSYARAWLQVEINADVDSSFG